MKNSGGFSLIEMMIAVGVMTVVILGFTTVMNSQGRASKVIEQKMEMVTLKQTLISMTNNPVVCRCQLDKTINSTNSTPLTIDVNQTTAQSLSLDAVHSSCDLGSDATLIAKINTVLSGSQTNQKVGAITVEQILPIKGAPYSYSAVLSVKVDSASQAQGLHPAVVPITIGVDPTSPANAMRIQSCSGVSYNGGSAPIICRKFGNIFNDSSGSPTANPGVGSVTTIAFAPGDCGGALPDANYIGVLSKTFVCGMSSQWVVHQPSEGTPGLSMFSLGDCTKPFPPADVQVVFIHQ